MKTQAGVVFGTPQYMSPEQGRGLPLDARSDLYALGILAFEMLTGNVPFHDDNPMTVIQMHLHAGVPPMPDRVPYSVQAIVRRALEKDAGRRYQSAGEMMQECQRVFAEVSGGGVSIGGGGVPKTVVAQPNMMAQPGMPMNPQMMGQPGMPPQMQQGYPPQQPMGMNPQMAAQMATNPMGQPMNAPPANPQGGYQPANAAAKTMIAGQSPFAGGAMPPPQQSGLATQGQPQGGYQHATPQQKTIVAGMPPPGLMTPGGPGMMPTNVQGSPSGGMQAQSGPNKTVLLQPSEGVVSVARTNQPIQPQPQQQGAMPGAATGGAVVQQGASTLFWIVSLVIGIAIGALAYVIVLQTQ